ncbi:MAG: ATP-binding protein [Bacillota bacterium]
METKQNQYEWPAIGQDKVSAYLEKTLLGGQPAQTYIFSGPRDLGKSTLALAFARNLWRLDGRTSPQGGFESDLYILEKEEGKKNISVEQAREFISRLSLSSFLNSYKIGIIKEAESLSLEAQNALLKTLEEPKEKVIIILLAEDAALLMQTIVSRSQTLYFHPVGPDSVYDYLLSTLELKRSAAKDLAAASLGRPLMARRWAENPEDFKEQMELVHKLDTFLDSPLEERLAMVSAAGNDNSLSVETVFSWIEVFESLWRDSLLTAVGQDDRRQYPSVSPERGQEPEASLRALAALKQLERAREYLRGNVTPKNVLESLALYF